MKKKIFTIFIFLGVFLSLHLLNCNENFSLEKIKLPQGFYIHIYASDIIQARAMALSTNGVLYVSSRAGLVYAIIDTNKDRIGDKKYIITDNLSMAYGLDFFKGDLYVSENDKIIVFKDIENNLQNPPKAKVILKGVIPDDKWHGGRYIKFGPDNKLYINRGVPCNVCLKENEIFGTISRINPDGSGFEIYAKGVRNSVGFDWDPATNEFWFTDNGRDQMGDNIPPDELNHANKKGLHFGFPYLHGKNIRDPEFGNNININNFTKPAMELGPHVAALGMRFYKGKMFPDEYKNSIFIAEHGSWNRSVPIGYRITNIKLIGNNAISYDVFAEGWLQSNYSKMGRPADVEILDDGSLLISDDTANVIYRIYYKR